jgi:hypothetical protein
MSVARGLPCGQRTLMPSPLAQPVNPPGLMGAAPAARPGAPQRRKHPSDAARRNCRTGTSHDCSLRRDIPLGATEKHDASRDAPLPRGKRQHQGQGRPSTPVVRSFPRRDFNPRSFPCLRWHNGAHAVGVAVGAGADRRASGASSRNRTGDLQSHNLAL